MDVVHPSMDMKKPDTPAPKPVSRQGATIAPSPSMTTPVTPSPEEPAQTPAPEPVSAAPQPAMAPATTAHQPQATSDWPDPLELATEKADMPLTDKPEEQAKEGTDTNSQPESTPLTSPFLPDTKVEKRPLGGAAPTDAVPELPVAGTGKEGLTVDDPNAQLPPEPETTAPLPAELQGDLVAIESGSAKEATVSHNAAAPEEKPAEATVTEPPAEENKPTGPVSIPQQYREEPSTGDQQSGAIYDTDTYHQPLAHPAKKKSGWLWVVWIILILVVGAGAGALLFFAGII